VLNGLPGFTLRPMRVKHHWSARVRAGQDRIDQGANRAAAWRWRPGRIPAGSTNMSNLSDRAGTAAPGVPGGELTAGAAGSLRRTTGCRDHPPRGATLRARPNLDRDQHADHMETRR